MVQIRYRFNYGGYMAYSEGYRKLVWENSKYYLTPQQLKDCTIILKKNVLMLKNLTIIF
jgi:hypothetical protein